MALTMLFSAVAAEGISITLNGQPLTSDVAPVMQNDRVLVPMRVIFEALGAKVEWDGSTNTVFAIATEKVIVLQIDSTTAFVNSESKTLDVPAQIIDDRTMVPIRFVSETLGAEVTWDETSSTVVIKK